MTVLYLTEQGSRLSREGDRLVVSREGQVMAEVPAGLVEAVYVFGNVTLTTPAITYLLRNGIDCVFLSQDGHYFGRLFASDSKFGLLRQRQYLALADPGLRLRVARAVVAGKVANQLALLRRRGVPEAQLGPLEGLIGEIEGAPDRERLLGIEGQASALYYGLYRRLFKVDLGFRGRTRRPPRDPVNSLLSLGYTLLGYAAQSAVYAVGLDPFGGFLHSTQYSRPSLALDLIEEFRVLVDGLVLRLVNLRRYQADDFHVGGEEPKGVLLTDEARKRYLADFEGLMGRTLKYPGQERPVTVRRALELQARQIARVVLGQQDGYRPLKFGSSEG